MVSRTIAPWWLAQAPKIIGGGVCALYIDGTASSDLRVQIRTGDPSETYFYVGTGTTLVHDLGLITTAGVFEVPSAGGYVFYSNTGGTCKLHAINCVRLNPL